MVAHLTNSILFTHHWALIFQPLSQSRTHTEQNLLIRLIANLLIEIHITLYYLRTTSNHCQLQVIICSACRVKKPCGQPHGQYKQMSGPFFRLPFKEWRSDWLIKGKWQQKTAALFIFPCLVTCIYQGTLFFTSFVERANSNLPPHYKRVQMRSTCLSSVKKTFLHYCYYYYSKTKYFKKGWMVY